MEHASAEKIYENAFLLKKKITQNSVLSNCYYTSLGYSTIFKRPPLKRQTGGGFEKLSFHLNLLLIQVNPLKCMHSMG